MCTEATSEDNSDKTSDLCRDMENEPIVNFLAPEKLMIIEVNVGDQRTKALIDSGASKSLMKKEFVKDIGTSSSESPEFVVGLGGKKVEVLGSVRQVVSVAGLCLEGEFLIVPNEGIEYDCIIGIDFLRCHNFNVNLGHRSFSVTGEDGSFVRVYLNEDNSVNKVMREQVPVYCARDVEINASKWTQVPINYDRMSSEERDELVYYEAKSGTISSLSGVFGSDDKDPFVFVENAGQKREIKQGQILGYAYTMLVMPDEEEDIDEEYEDWTEARIERDVSLKDNLTDHEKEQVREMLLELKLALSKGDNDIGKAAVEPHRIEVTQQTPIWQKPRQFSQPTNDQIEQQCADLLANDILEHSDSGWSSAVVPVRKPDGTLRLCIDYRQVNKVTRKENYPMPNLVNCIYRPDKVKFFTKIDLVRGYYQVPIEKDSRKYTAFSTPQQHYQFKRLSFGLKNSGMAFQRVMQQILAPIMSQNIIIYIDDILILSSSFEEHLEMVGKVLRLLKEYKIKAKVSKCEFFREEVTFLGHVINTNGIKKSPEYVEKVKQAKKPQTVHEMRKFLGLVNFQRKFVQNCSLLTAPLTKWSVGAKGKKIVWNEEMDRAFAKLKEEIMRDVLLSYPDYGKDAPKMELYVDASSTGSGAYLMQKQGNEYKVIAYNSMTFSETQRRYSPTDRELAALRWGIQNFRCFLAGVPFILVTDCKPLIYMHSMAPSNSRLMRTLQEMAEFEFELKYRPGVSMRLQTFCPGWMKVQRKKSRKYWILCICPRS